MSVMSVKNDANDANNDANDEANEANHEANGTINKLTAISFYVGYKVIFRMALFFYAFLYFPVEFSGRTWYYDK